MRKLIYSAVFLTVSFLVASCSDWLEPKKVYEDPVNVNGGKDGDYYTALRAYKETEHPIMFGWFSGWTGIGDMMNQLRGVPDSMDVVSLWENGDNLTPEQISDLDEIREVKGTKVIVCSIITNLGNGLTPEEVDNDFIVDGVKYASKEEARAAYWGWYGDYGNPGRMEEAIRRYADEIAMKSVLEYGYDGYDIDYEPNFGNPGNLSSYPERMHIFIDQLSKYFGPASGTGRLLVVDGEPQSLNPESGPLLDYYVVQAYDCTGDSNLDYRFGLLLDKFAQAGEDESTVLKKTIWCENFEANAGSGGPEFTTRSGEILPYSLMGMAMYSREGVDAKIGGCGAYRFNMSRMMDDYLKIRKCIQIMNPAEK